MRGGIFLSPLRVVPSSFVKPVAFEIALSRSTVGRAYELFWNSIRVFAVTAI